MSELRALVKEILDEWYQAESQLISEFWSGNGDPWKEIADRRTEFERRLEAILAMIDSSDE